MCSRGLEYAWEGGKGSDTGYHSTGTTPYQSCFRLVHFPIVMVTYSRLESVRVLTAPYHIKPPKPNNSKNLKILYFESVLG